MSTNKHPTNLTLGNIVLAFLIAVSTNHSLGEIVYKKQTIQQIKGESAKPGQANKSKSETPQTVIVEIIQRSSETYAIVATSLSLNPGTFIDFYRRSHNGSLIQTGNAQIKMRQAKGYLAKILQSSTQQSRILFQDYPEVMIGDHGLSRPVEINRIVQVTPTKNISYFKLFEDPNAHPETFELSESGKKVLTLAAMAFRNSKLPTLLIEAHTDADGDSNTNQVESYQRALTIRQFLINELGFDANRIIAIGMGEIEPVKQPFLPDHIERARRIILKAKGY